MNRYRPIRDAAPASHVVNHGVAAALPSATLWCAACASCFALGYCLALALARHLGAL